MLSVKEQGNKIIIYLNGHEIVVEVNEFYVRAILAGKVQIFNFFEFLPLFEEIAEFFPQTFPTFYKGVSNDIRTKHNVSMIIHYLMPEYIKKLKSIADPTIIEIHKIFRDRLNSPNRRSRPAMPSLIFFSTFFSNSNRYILKDIVRFNILPAVLDNVFELLKFHFKNNFKEFMRYFSWQRDRELLRFLNGSGLMCEANIYDVSKFFPFIEKKMLPGIISFLNDSGWMKLLSHNCVQYRALNVTVSNFSKGIPPEFVMQMPECIYERPLKNKPEFLIYSFSKGHAVRERILKNSSKVQIEEAIQLFCEYVNRSVSHRHQNIREFVSFICDYPFPHEGNILTLTRRAIRWHNDRQNDLSCENEELDPKTKVAEPPIKFPEIEGIRFLSTVGDIMSEAKRMHHCVCSYVDAACRGDSFLFHCENNGELATAELDSSMNLVQVFGPFNKKNSACEYANRKLSQFGGISYGRKEMFGRDNEEDN